MIYLDCFCDWRLKGQPERLESTESHIFQETSCLDVSLCDYRGRGDLAQLDLSHKELNVSWMAFS